jgi:hypothetical protein
MRLNFHSQSLAERTLRSEVVHGIKQGVTTKWSLVVKQLQDKKHKSTAPLWWLCRYNYFWEGTRGGGFSKQARDWALLHVGEPRAQASSRGYGQPLAEVQTCDLQDATLSVLLITPNRT